MMDMVFIFEKTLSVLRWQCVHSGFMAWSGMLRLAYRSFQRSHDSSMCRQGAPSPSMPSAKCETLRVNQSSKCPVSRELTLTGSVSVTPAVTRLSIVKPPLVDFPPRKVDLTAGLRASRSIPDQQDCAFCGLGILWGGLSVLCGTTRGNCPMYVVYVLGVVCVCCL